MFFDLNLLCKRKRGKFAAVWLAATRGIKHVPKADQRSLDITITCREIMEYVMSNSTAVKNRLSLYLSAQLVYGTVLIHREQIIFFEQSILTFLCTIKRPLTIVPESAFKKPKQPPKKKRKVTERIDLPELQFNLGITDEEMEREMNRPLVFNVADPEAITLRDDIIVPPRVENEEFGDEGNIDMQLANLQDFPWTIDPETQRQPEIEPGKRKTSEAIPPPSPSKRAREAAPEAGVIVTEVGSLSPDIVMEGALIRREDLTEVVEPEILAQPLPETLPQPEAPPDKDQAQVQDQAQIPDQAQIQDQDSEIMAPPRGGRGRNVSRRRRRINLNPDIIVPASPVRPRRNSLHRTYPTADDLFHSSPIIRSTIKNLDSTPTKEVSDEAAKELINAILAGIDPSEEDFFSILNRDRDAGARDSSANMRMRAQLSNISSGVDSSGKILEAGQQRSRRLNFDDPSLTEKSILPLPEALPDLQPIDDQVPRSPQVSIIQRVSYEREPRRTVVPPLSEDEIPSRMHHSTPIIRQASVPTTFDPKAKHAEVLKLIRELFKQNGRTPLKFEQICSPLTRRTAAVTFNSLLVLHAKQYVILKPADASIELNLICPGPRLR